MPHQHGPIPSFSIFTVAMALAIVLSLSLGVLAFPFIQQTQVHVVTERDKITNVWIDTPKVNLISKLFPLSPKIGAYTIEVNIKEAGITVWSAKMENVPSGEYMIVWIDGGTPTQGTYTIEVKLSREIGLVDTYSYLIAF